MKATVLFVLFLAIGAKQVSSQACHLREIDLCMAVGMFHFQSSGVPSDDEQITEWCESLKDVSDCMRNFSGKCLSPLQRELTGLIAGGVEDAQNQLCTPGSEYRTKYLKHAECLANGASSDIFKSHGKDFLAAVEKVFETEFKDRLPALCCGYQRFEANVQKSTEEMCGRESVELINNILALVITDMPNTICKTYDPNTSECQRLLPPIGATSKGSESKSQVVKLLDTLLSNL